MIRVREPMAFAAVLAGLVFLFFHETIAGGKVLSPGDVVFASTSFGDGSYEPANRLLMDPVLQFAPWIEFNRAMIRSGKLPLWNPWAGCGAPHLANGQSAVFDPFQVIAYLGTLPAAYAWMAACRLWVAGWGMFLLARSWRLGPWGRWFAGLTYPFCGFLVLWLLYPVTNVALWLPWLFLTTDRVLDRPTPRSMAGLAAVVGLVLVGGHVQTSAHVLLASGTYLLWRCGAKYAPRPGSRIVAPMAWSTAILIGIGLAAVEIVPLAIYLAKSPVWADRKAENATAGPSRPRWLDAACQALPYAFGSQRKGQPHLAKAVGVQNLNESAGGYAGLATLLWLAPMGYRARKSQPRARFLAGLVLIGVMGAYGIPPVAPILKTLPVLDVADHRRLLLWVAFGLVLLGGIGLDSLQENADSRAWRWWSRSWMLAALLAVVAAAAIAMAGPWMKSKAIAHYAKAATRSSGAEASSSREKAERQARLASTFLPRYYLLAAAHLALLAGLAEVARRKRLDVRPVLLGLTLVDLFAFGFGANPAIPPGDDRPDSPLIAYLRREASPPSRIVSVGAELPPNLLMRYGLMDARNYDSIELGRSLAWFDPMYEPDPDRPLHTSRREVRWEGVIRAKNCLRMAGVVAVVGASAPPAGAFDRVDRVGGLWVGRWSSLAPPVANREPGEIRVDLRGDNGQVRWVAETFDPGWKATIDGRPAATFPHLGTFLGADVPPGATELVFRYEPPEFRVALMISLVSLAAVVVLSGSKPRPRNPPLESWTPWSRRVRIEATPSLRSSRTGPPLH